MPQALSTLVVQAARRLGRRAIVSRGWAALSAPEDDVECLTIGEVNVLALFPRVAAVVHHGGAGTTTAAALAGAPQVVVPQVYDQHYFAHRVHTLRVGEAHPAGTPTVESLAMALAQALRHDVADRAMSIAATMRRDGALIAAEGLVDGVRS